MSPVFGLRTFTVDDLQRHREATEAACVKGWAAYGPYLLSKYKEGRSAVLVDEDDGSWCTYQWRNGDTGSSLEVLFPPMPMHPDALRRALERCHDHNRDRSARIMRIDEGDVDAVGAATELDVRPRREQYLYSPAAYRDLAGRKLRAVRRQVATFEEIDGVQIADYAPADREDCRRLLREWKTAHRAAHGTAGGTSATRRAIDLAGSLAPRDLVGEIVRVHGRVVAFAFGGEIRPGWACFFDAKCDPAIPGLGYAHRLHFLQRFDDATIVNDGSDAGRSGLRQLKQSFRPIGMHREFRARPRN